MGFSRVIPSPTLPFGAAALKPVPYSASPSHLQTCNGRQNPLSELTIWPPFTSKTTSRNTGSPPHCFGRFFSKPQDGSLKRKAIEFNRCHHFSSIHLTCHFTDSRFSSLSLLSMSPSTCGSCLTAALATKRYHCE